MEFCLKHTTCWVYLMCCDTRQYFRTDTESILQRQYQWNNLILESLLWHHSFRLYIQKNCPSKLKFRSRSLLGVSLKLCWLIPKFLCNTENHTNFSIWLIFWHSMSCILIIKPITYPKVLHSTTALSLHFWYFRSFKAPLPHLENGNLTGISKLTMSIF